jgi:hypothetical protein
LNRLKAWGVTVEASRLSQEKSGPGSLNTSMNGSRSPRTFCT